MKKLVNVLIAGCGSRGRIYANYSIVNPEEMKIVGIAETDRNHREAMVRQYNIAPDKTFNNWQELTKHPKFADAVIIAIPDNMHAKAAAAFAEKGYAILLEKPMAVTEQDCRNIVDIVTAKGNIFGVCHVMRYTEYTQKLKRMIHNGLIGEVVNIQHIEPVGYWHQAHSYVRGNWRNSSESSFMLMTKSCHDLDWLRYIVESRCIKISSFGNLKHFKKENKPAHASDRCLDCYANGECPYSATKIYLDRALRGVFSWPVDVITGDLSINGVKEALRTGPYGRCVYECDNDVVDNQVVNMLFENGSTASFTMTAFDFVGQRRTSIFGTKGCIHGNGEKIEYLNFRDGNKSVIDIGISDDGTLLTGHGGGDYELIKTFISAVAQNDPSKIYSGPEETLETHLSVFAAEKSRLESRILCYTSDGWV